MGVLWAFIRLLERLMGLLQGLDGLVQSAQWFMVWGLGFRAWVKGFGPRADTNHDLQTLNPKPCEPYAPYAL